MIVEPGCISYAFAMKNILLALTLVSLCAGCAIIPEQVEVNYAPDAAAPRTPILAAGAVQLQVADMRHAESPAWIADKKNGYGMRMASVMAQRPVADLVRDALAQELTARGVHLGEGRTVIAVEVTRFESVGQARFFSVGAIGSADLSVQVRRMDGTIAYARTFSTSNDEEAGLAGTPGQARRAVERALSKVVGQTISDPAFIRALSTEPRTT